MSESERRRRTFSDSFKIQKVREIELRKTKISEICREYEVSVTAVRKWLDKFGIMSNKKDRRL